MPLAELKEGVKLEGCPLCGTSVELKTNTTSTYAPQFWVKCPNPRCGATLASSPDMDEAVARWNRRH